MTVGVLGDPGLTTPLAEGLINHFLGDRWEAFSARTKPTGAHRFFALQRFWAYTTGEHTTRARRFR
jgi:hypothetical protein